jgi:ketosteroid isomerase-like protein
MSDANREIIRKINHAFAIGVFDEFLKYCSEDVVWTIIGDRVVSGRENIRQWLNEMAAENSEKPQFANFAALIADGEYVVSRGQMTMKDTSGKTVPYSYCDIYRFREGEIAELASFVVNTAPEAKSAGQSA